MTDTQLVIAYLVALGPVALVLALAAIECKRELMKPIRAWRVRHGDRAFVREQQRAANLAMRARDNEQLLWRRGW